MIEYIKGELTELSPALAVVEAHGVGYALAITLNTYTALQKTGAGHEVKVFVHEQLVTGGRDDSFSLFGFATKQERELYRLLITVNGIGGNTARMVLSATTPGDLCNTIASGNEKMLRTVKGIGPKAAQRIILELKDKLARESAATGLDFSGGNAGNVNPFTSKAGEAAAALAVLGYSSQEAAAALKGLDTDALSLEELIRQALKRMAR